jgi:ribosomal protein S18 acetylase RimI-like enzyme
MALPRQDIINKQTAATKPAKVTFMDFTFEPLQKKDVDACVNLVISSLGSQAKAYGDKETIKQMIYSDQTATVVAKRQDKIVGFINGSILPYARIMFLTVADEQSAKEGLGSYLIDKFLEETKKRSPYINFILHNEFADNFNAIGLYSIKGFKITGYIRDPITNRDIVVMKKSFSQ